MSVLKKGGEQSLRTQTFQQKKAGASDDVKITTDDYASILLHFEDSLRGVVTVSQVSAGRKARLWFEVDGSEDDLARALAWLGEQGVQVDRIVDEGR